MKKIFPIITAISMMVASTGCNLTSDSDKSSETVKSDIVKKLSAIEAERNNTALSDDTPKEDIDIVTKTEPTTEPPTEPPAKNGFEYKGCLPTDGDKMTILGWTGDDLDVMLETWKEATGYKDNQINFVNFRVGGGEAPAKFDQYFLGGEDVDMFMVEADWALKYINDDTATAPLADLGFAEVDFANQYSYTMEVGKSTAGVIKATSWQAAPGGWCYRTDLADQYLGVKTPEDMQKKVADWDAFQATAKEVYKASGNKTAITTTLGGIWQVFSANRAKPWVDANNKLVVDDFCNTFITLAKNMSDKGYVTKEQQWTDGWYAAGQTDDTMGYFVSTWGFGPAILKSAAGGEGGATYGKWNVCQGPTPYFWGGTWACVSPKTDNADMVANFMHYFTINEEAMKAYALAKPDYVNNMNAMQAIVDERLNNNPLLGGQDQFAVLHEAAKNIDLNGLITPYDAAIKTQFLNAVNAYCAGETADEAACLEDFKNRVAENVVEVTVK